MRLAACAIALVVAACGGDEGTTTTAARPPGPGAAPAAPPPPPPTPGAAGGKLLLPMRSIEDRVSCPSPTPAKPCDPKKLPTSCTVAEGEQKQYCLETTKGWFCGPCAERERIRQSLKPRDFATDQTRDPFASVLVQSTTQQNTAAAPLQKDVIKRCGEGATIRLSTYSFLDLKLVGVIKLGLNRKLLMMDPVNLGHVIGRNECIGKERAYVKDIGEEPGIPSKGILGRGIWVTFEIPPDATAGDARPPEERTIYLNPNARIGQGTSLPTDQPRPTDTTTPVIGPNNVGAGSGAPQGNSGVPIVAPR